MMDVQVQDDSGGWGVPQGKAVVGAMDLVVEEEPSAAGGVSFGKTEYVGTSKAARRRQRRKQEAADVG